MTRDEVTQVVREVLSEERRIQKDALDVVALKAVSAILTAFGMNDDDRIEMRADFRYLRHWRRAAESMQRGWWIAITALLVSGVASAIYLGLKTIFGKGV